MTETVQQKVKRLKESGLAFSEIAQVIGKTRQRAHQIFHGHRGRKTNSQEGVLDATGLSVKNATTTKATIYRNGKSKTITFKRKHSQD